MQTRLTIVLLLLLISVEIRAQADLAQSMANCIEAMDINRLSQSFADEMEISINGNGEIVSSSAAKYKIDAFLSNNGVSTCAISHNGARKGSGFCILSLKTERGDAYRIYSYYKEDESGKMKIQQFRIDYDG